MADLSNRTINECIMRFARRAERVDREKLVATFVSSGPLFTVLSTSDHQILHGRRGTGKTHALQYLADDVASKGDIAIYIDMRMVGSDGSIYNDEAQSLSDRATRLLVDVLGFIHEEMLGVSVERSDIFDLTHTGPLLDALADSISRVRVVGPVAVESHQERENAQEQATSVSLQANPVAASAAVDLSDQTRTATSNSTRRSQQGRERLTVHFGTVGQALARLVGCFQGCRFWVLLDEWSAIPLDIQPYLADLLRRAVFPVNQISVKLAAIEHRSNFQLNLDNNDYIGIEIGSDAQANLNLDDFMVFDNDQIRAKTFFRDLLCKHFRASEELSPDDGPQGPAEFVGQAFTQITAFEEFVRAVEGVPRDAINIAEIAAQRAFNSPISVPHVRSAARDWYQRDKSAVIQENNVALELRGWIIDQVIAHRKARAFLLRADRRHQIIDKLFDARLVHILKKSVSAHDQPGVRYFVYKLDYGCYVDLINTVRGPDGLLPSDNGNATGFVEVPPDDYRSIRRAILDLDEFFRQH